MPINMGSGKALDVVEWAGEFGNNVAQYTSNGTRAQKWIAVRLKNGKYLLYSALTENLGIDVTGANIKMEVMCRFIVRTKQLPSSFIYKYNC